MLYRLVIAALFLICGTILFRAHGENAPVYTGPNGVRESSTGILQLPPLPFRDTYLAKITNYSAYATPTDLVCLWGSATKIVKIQGEIVYVQSNVATLQAFYWVKRTAANTGGTPTTATPILKSDSAFVAPTASVVSYGSAPTLGAGSFVTVVFGSSVALTAAPAAVNFIGLVASGNKQIDPQGVILRGINEGICLNWNSNALQAGWVSNFDIEWTEE